MRVADVSKMRTAEATRAELAAFVDQADAELASYVPGSDEAAAGTVAAAATSASASGAESGKPAGDVWLEPSGQQVRFPFIPRSAFMSFLQNRLEKCGREFLNDHPEFAAAREDLVAPESPGSLPGYSDETFPSVVKDEALLPGGGDFQPYGPCDWHWIVCETAKWTKGVNHPFNKEPARATLAESARLVLFSDWASGTPRAKALTQQGIPTALSSLADGFELHAIHLGDTYYIGDEDEQREHVLGLWPDLGDDAHAWALPGNHDYYSGGHAFFNVLLGDARFREQRSSDGNPTSLFELSNDHWRVIGLDTGWKDNDLPPDGWSFLEEAMAAAHDAGQRIVLLSHHQQHSSYAKVPPTFEQSCNALLAKYPTAAWFWGHEHRCIAYERRPEVALASCIGNGGLAEWVSSAPLPIDVLFDCEDEYVDPTDPASTWRKFGFVVVDLEADQMNVRYFFEDGTPYEALTVALS
jgi:hypothetical protein